jgi:hypothetical protein
MARKVTKPPPPKPEEEDDYDFGDDGEERCIPPVRAWHASDKLAPAPPANWIVVFRYEPPPPAFASLLAMWVYLLHVVHDMERKAGKRLHIIARTPAGGRVLLVDPSLRREFAYLINAFDYHEREIGGTDAFGVFGDAAFDGLVARKWRAMSIPQRMAALSSNALPRRYARHGRFHTIPEDERYRLYDDPEFLTE